MPINLGDKLYSSKPEAALVNIKSRGSLTHPNDFIFGLLTDVEKSFAKHCKDNDVFLLTLDDFFTNNKSINFPCIQHKTEILTNIISNFIIMRMRQYSLVTNKNAIKVNAKKKKLAKLVNT